MALDHSFILSQIKHFTPTPLLSIAFVPSVFYAYVWHILEGTSKAYIFSRNRE